MTTINKKTLQNDKCRILCDRDLILKIRPQELRVRYITEITFVRSKKFCMFEFK